MATFVKILGIIWLALAVTTIAVGYAGIWWRDGFWAAAELLSPLNVLNFALTIAVLAPGLLLLVWAKRIKSQTAAKSVAGGNGGSQTLD